MGYNLSLVPGPNLVAMRIIGHTFWFPRRAPQFFSPMMNKRNFYAAYNMSEAEVGRRVAGYLKPIGFVSGRGSVKAARLVEESGGLALDTGAMRFDGRLCRFYSLTHGGVIGKLFDLDALVNDYRAWLVESKRAVRAIEREMRRIEVMKLEDFLDFGTCTATYAQKVGRRWKRNDGPEAYARCGLLLGYPIQTTVALIRQDLGLSGGVT